MLDFLPWCNIKVSLQEFSFSFCASLVHYFAFSLSKNTRKEVMVLIVALGDAEGFLCVSRFAACYHKVSLALDHIWHEMDGECGARGDEEGHGGG